MEHDDLISRLAAHRTIGAAPREELEWIAAHGDLRRLDTGQILTPRAAGFVEGLFIVLSGHIALHVDRANGREKIMDWRAGDVTGLLPYSRLISPPGDSTAEQPSEIFVVHRDHLQGLTRECHALTSILVHVMVDRARHFTSSDLHAEKMVSLGKLSAGVAHELNNPASAIARSAGLLGRAVTASEDAARALGAVALTPHQLASIDAVRAQALAPVQYAVRSPLEQAEREAAFADWLDDHGADGGDAESLAETAIALPMLDELARAVDGSPLHAAVRWLAAGCLTRHLAAEIEQAAGRISDLVESIKAFTHMDHATVHGPVDVPTGLAQTLTLLKSKARGKGAAVTVEVEPGLPPAHGTAGALNQIWANLIDNAIDAVGQSGAVTITAASDRDSVVVRVIDDGPGIPPENQRRIFDPFFTTKRVGQGTGLGLDIVTRIVRQHHGTIAVESEPGRTVFTVTLPREPAAVEGVRT